MEMPFDGLQWDMLSNDGKSLGIRIFVEFEQRFDGWVVLEVCYR